MSRINGLLTVIVPSMLAGGLMFNSALGHASAGGGEMFGFWPAASDVAAPVTANPARTLPPPRPTRPTRPTPPAPVTPRTPGTPPRPPMPPQRGMGGGGVSVSIHNGKVQIDGLHHMVLAQLDRARDTLRNNPSIPKDVRDKILARLDKVRATVDKRLANIKVTDLDQLESEMEKMGEEIGQAMDGLDKDMDKLGKDFAKQFGKNFTVNIDSDKNDDDDDNLGSIDTPDVDADDDDMKDAIKDLRDLALKPDQKDRINKLRADSDTSVAIAKKQIDELSAKLKAALANPATSDAEIGRYVDQISAQEATIRKARIVAWAQARRVLDDAQRKRVEDAATKKRTK